MRLNSILKKVVQLFKVGIPVLVIIVIVYFRFVYGPKAVKTDYLQEVNVSFSEKIIRKELDSVNLARSYLIFGNGFKYIPSFSNGLWVVTHAGDSICKAKGDNFYTIFVNSSPIDTIIFKFKLEDYQ